MRSKPSTTTTIAVIAVLAGASLVPILVRAQYRVNNQIYGNSGPVRAAGTIQIPSATYATPSQTRMAIHASGATPSQLKTEYNRIGPMTPNGAISYVPPPVNPYTKPSQVSSGNYINTQGVRSAPTGASAAAPSYAAPSNPYGTGQASGSIRYTPAAQPSYSSPVTSWSSIQSNSSISGNAQPMSGSIPPPTSFNSSLMSSPTGSVRYSP